MAVLPEQPVDAEGHSDPTPEPREKVPQKPEGAPKDSQDDREHPAPRPPHSQLFCRLAIRPVQHKNPFTHCFKTAGGGPSQAWVTECPFNKTEG